MTVCTSRPTPKNTALFSELDKKYCEAYGVWREWESGEFYVIDLTEDDLKKNLRKSYKSLVNKQDGIIFSSTIYNLKQLHFKSSGRQTRSDETWGIQQIMIDAGEGFVVELYKDGTLISAAFFMKNEYCCYYAVAASLKGVNSHPVIWAAIEYCKAEGLKRFELGEKLEGTEKEKNISKFKAGFGANLEKRLVDKEKP